MFKRKRRICLGDRIGNERDEEERKVRWKKGKDRGGKNRKKYKKEGAQKIRQLIYGYYKCKITDGRINGQTEHI